jgi:hypothetical protein
VCRVFYSVPYPRFSVRGPGVRSDLRFSQQLTMYTCTLTNVGYGFVCPRPSYCIAHSVSSTFSLVPYLRQVSKAPPGPQSGSCPSCSSGTPFSLVSPIAPARPCLPISSQPRAALPQRLWYLISPHE